MCLTPRGLSARTTLPLDTDMNLSDKDFYKLTEYIKKQYGLELSNKRRLVEGRLGCQMTERGYSDCREYLKACFADVSGKELNGLVSLLTTNHTFFMREPEHYRFMREAVLPYLKTAHSDSRTMRIWSAGCSSGEEAYTAAMTVCEYLGEQKSMWDTRILATDISVKALSAAQRGIYTERAVSDLPIDWREKYFTKERGRYKISDTIRGEVIFRMFNLMDGIPYKREPFDLIFCRNVMIYFDKDTRRALVNKLYDVLTPGGYLFVGHSEGITGEMSRYEYIRPAVYRRPK